MELPVTQESRPQVSAQRNESSHPCRTRTWTFREASFLTAKERTIQMSMRDKCMNKGGIPGQGGMRNKKEYSAHPNMDGP